MCGGLHTSLESYEEGGGVACAKSGLAVELLVRLMKQGRDGKAVH